MEPGDGFTHYNTLLGDASISSFSSMLTESSTAPSTSTANLSTSAPGVEEEGHHYPADMLGFTAASAFIIAILGTFGNLLTIIALPMTKNLRTTATAFVVNLAVVELMFCVFILPMSGAQYLYLQRHLEGSLLTDRHCIFFTTLRYSITQVELQTILAIALTRAIAVSQPRLYQNINQPTVIGVYIAIIWLYSIAMRIPPAIGVFGQYEYNPNTMECDLDNKNRLARLVYLVMDAFIPVLLIFILYFFVFIMVVRRAVVRQRKFSTNFPPPQAQVKLSSARVARSSQKNKKVVPPTSSASTSSTTGTGTQRKGSTSSFKSLKKMVSETSLRRRFLRAARLLTGKCSRQSSTMSQRLNTNRRDMRVARTIFIIFLLVLVCSVPVAMIHAVDPLVKRPVRFLLVHILYWLQYCLNVVVYVLMNRQYRDAYVDCLSRVFPRFKRHHGRRFFWEKASISSRPQPNLTSTKANNPGNDSCASEADQAVSGNPMPAAQCRLTAIPEGGSSAASDSVFSDQQKKSPDEPLLDEHKKEENKCEADSYKEEEEKKEEERQVEEEDEEDSLLDTEHWLTKNGTTLSKPDSESMV